MNNKQKINEAAAMLKQAQRTIEMAQKILPAALRRTEFNLELGQFAGLVGRASRQLSEEPDKLK